MTRLTKVFLWILLPFMCSAITLGYAVVSDWLFIQGEVNVPASAFSGVYISDVSVYSENRATSVSFNYFKPTNLSVSARPAASGGSITYKVTVHNNTDVTYWYIKQDYLEDYESNSLIGNANGITVVTKDHPGDTSQTFNSDDWVPPQTYRDFYVTYTFGSSAQTYPVTLINFSFGIKMDAVHDQFLTVLNDPVPSGGYEYITQIFDEKFRETGETVIASVGDEKEIFDTLFGPDLTVNIDGVEVPVTVMIRRENVDGRDTGDNYSGSSGAPTGCEYTVYVTVDSLDSPTGKAMVYAVSYSNGGTASVGDNWYQIGQLYEGEANIIDYDTSADGMQGAFDIYSWVATPNRYEAANGIVYLVGQEQGDQYDKLKTLDEIMSTADQDIFNDIDNTRILKTVYDIINDPANAYKAGLLGLQEAFYDAAPFYNVMNNGQEIKVARNCTRAEIVPFILNIQTALDYYNQVNP